MNKWAHISSSNTQHRNKVHTKWISISGPNRHSSRCMYATCQQLARVSHNAVFPNPNWSCWGLNPRLCCAVSYGSSSNPSVLLLSTSSTACATSSAVAVQFTGYVSVHVTLERGDWDHSSDNQMASHITPALLWEWLSHPPCIFHNVLFFLFHPRIFYVSFYGL